MPRVRGGSDCGESARQRKASRVEGAVRRKAAQIEVEGAGRGGAGQRGPRGERQGSEVRCRPTEKHFDAQSTLSTLSAQDAPGGCPHCPGRVIFTGLYRTHGEYSPAVALVSYIFCVVLGDKSNSFCSFSLSLLGKSGQQRPGRGADTLVARS